MTDDVDRLFENDLVYVLYDYWVRRAAITNRDDDGIVLKCIINRPMK